MKKTSIKTNVFLVTTFIGIKAAVTAMKLGVSDDISRPFDFNDLLLIVQQVFALKEKCGNTNYKFLDSSMSQRNL